MATSEDVGFTNLQWSILLIEQLIQSGIDHFILSPGSRSTPLALAVARNPRAHYWVVIDERSAAFVALGQSKLKGSASALICTSGSAVANWLPAVVEANHSATPLLLLSADRPPELHRRGANQTIEQVGLFGEQVRAIHPLSPPDEVNHPEQQIRALVDQVNGQLNHLIPGPVQINIPFRTPLLPETMRSIAWNPSPRFTEQPLITEDPLHDLSHLHQTLYDRRGVILCGEGGYNPILYPLLIELADHLDCPILADPLSNLRWGHPHNPRVISHYDGFLRSPHRQQQLQPEWVLQLGQLPLSTPLSSWLESYPPEHYITIQHRQLWSDPLTLSTETLTINPATLCQQLLTADANNCALAGWFSLFEQTEAETVTVAQQLVNNPIGLEGKLHEQQIIQQLHQHLPPETILFSGNSMVIRDIDGWFSPRSAPLRLIANRGASGIDGNLSTICGIRSVTPADIPVIALVGDLTLIHDLNALSLMQKIGGNLTLLVINNGGGNIFSYLPPATLPEFEPLWLTPPDVNFEQAAALYGIDHQRIERHQEFALQLQTALQQTHPKLIELVVDRDASIAAHQHYWELLQ